LPIPYSSLGAYDRFVILPDARRVQLVIPGTSTCFEPALCCLSLRRFPDDVATGSVHGIGLQELSDRRKPVSNGQEAFGRSSGVEVLGG
jgi:hypothetical protein